MIASLTGQLRAVEDDRIHLQAGPIVYEPSWLATVLKLPFVLTVCCSTICPSPSNTARPTEVRTAPGAV
jgi:hypothetical protein